MTDSHNQDRRQSDGKILQLETQIKQLATNDEQISNSLNQLRHDFSTSISELRNFIIQQEKPQWQLYLGALALLGAFFAYWVNQTKEPLMIETQRSLYNIEKLEDKFDTHTDDGHPETVIQRLENLEKIMDSRLTSTDRLHEADIEHLTRWIERIDERGSVVHYGPNSTPHKH